MSATVLAATLLIVVAALAAHRGAPAAGRIRDRLVAQVQARNDALAALQSRLDDARSQAAVLEQAALTSSSAGARLSARLGAEELAAGTVAVHGPGLQVRLDDEPGGANHVLDRDLQSVVNALWAAGAEAIAVNGQRLTTESAIRQAGSAILVNLQPLAPPYDVQALGDPVAVDTSFGASPATARMRAYAQLYGLRFSYHRESALTLPAAPGLSLRYARPSTAGGHG